ncbi:MAG: hypothetical protein JSV31_23600 [Desulfobacterales bacterium]|nr:MAG: hypothetical protein JSV31_23600 [Desulfobacterales bacterium]
MKRSKCIILVVFLVFSLPYIYGGCVVVFSSGDIDKDKENSDSDSSGPYFGVTSKAFISATSAEDLAGGAFAGGLISGTNGSSESSHEPIDTQIGVFLPLRIPLALGDTLCKIEFTRIPISLFESNVQTESGTYDGSCGGSFSYEINLDRASAKFNGSFSFADYCDQGIEISGETEVDGTFERETVDFVTAYITFDNLTDGFLTLDGEMSIDFSDSAILATLTAFGEDNASGQVYWLKNYSMNITEFAGYVEIEIFGTFYHAKYGFVNMTTTDSFVVHDVDDWPTSGQIVIQGATDTKAQLTAIDHLHYAVEVDSDGDGQYDWDSGILNWLDT